MKGGFKEHKKKEKKEVENTKIRKAGSEAE